MRGRRSGGREEGEDEGREKRGERRGEEEIKGQREGEGKEIMQGKRQKVRLLFPSALSHILSYSLRDLRLHLFRKKILGHEGVPKLLRL